MVTDVTGPAVLAILALLVPTAGERAVPHGWFLRLGDDAWAYSPTDDDLPPERTRGAMFLHLGDDGTALQLMVTVREDTSSRAGRPTLSPDDGFAMWAGTWRRGPAGEVVVELGFRLSSKVVFNDPPGARTLSAAVHGRHLLAGDGPYVPIGFAYPADTALLRRQLFETSCGGSRRDPACRTVRR
jgi:hypothetical protein